VNALELREGSILFIDELHTVMGAGFGVGRHARRVEPAQTGAPRRARIPAIRGDDCPYVPLAHGAREREPALASEFHKKSKWGEPSVAETTLILKGLSSR